MLVYVAISFKCVLVELFSNQTYFGTVIFNTINVCC